MYKIKYSALSECDKLLAYNTFLLLQVLFHNALSTTGSRNASTNTSASAGNSTERNGYELFVPESGSICRSRILWFGPKGLLSEPRSGAVGNVRRALSLSRPDGTTDDDRKGLCGITHRAR